MGATVGRRVYWPGSGIVCPDPELLEIGNDVVFGSRSEIYTSDSVNIGKVIIKDGGTVTNCDMFMLLTLSLAMVADRVVLLPGVTVGIRTIMGSGALAKPNTVYKDGSTWTGSGK